MAPAEPKQRYQNSRLTHNDALAVLTALEQLMTEQKSYLSPNLTQLVKPAGCTQAKVSQLSKSFNTYANEYCISEANQLLTDEMQLNMDTVAVRCGFNSSQVGQ